MGKSFPLSPSKYWVPTLEQLDIAINTALEEEELRIRQERLVQPIVVPVLGNFDKEERISLEPVQIQKIDLQENEVKFRETLSKPVFRF